MARKITPLTDTQIKANKPKDKDYSLFDGGGMYLLVKSNGSKIWRFKYTRPYTQKGALISFGSYPEISLQQARKQREQSRNLIKQGMDPQEYKTEQKQRKQMELNNTFYAIAERWKITDVFTSPKVKNQPAISPKELPEFMQALAMANIELQTRCVIEWQLLTLTRPSEAVGAKWQEIDFDNKVWSIPAERMKMDRPHNIPLSIQAMRLLDMMKPVNSKNEFIFPSMKPPYNKLMSSQIANIAIKRMGFQGRLVAHGLRSLASGQMLPSIEYFTTLGAMHKFIGFRMMLYKTLEIPISLCGIN